MIKLGTYIARPKGGDLIPCSDAAGEIEEVGDRVTSFKKVPAFGKRL
jgi:NADPH:quinone reductase-like Zn-dependent oxidoreductase